MRVFMYWLPIIPAHATQSASRTLKRVAHETQTASSGKENLCVYFSMYKNRPHLKSLAPLQSIPILKYKPQTEPHRLSHKTNSLPKIPIPGALFTPFPPSPSPGSLPGGRDGLGSAWGRLTKLGSGGAREKQVLKSSGPFLSMPCQPPPLMESRGTPAAAWMLPATPK